MLPLRSELDQSKVSGETLVVMAVEATPFGQPLQSQAGVSSILILSASSQGGSRANNVYIRQLVPRQTLSVPQMLQSIAVKLTSLCQVRLVSAMPAASRELLQLLSR